MKLAWLAKPRPNLILAISQLAQVTKSMFAEKSTIYNKYLQKALQQARAATASVQFSKLCCESLRVMGYFEAGLSNNYDHTSQLGRVIILMNNIENASLIAF